jgi:hypothetical protein
MAGGRGVGAVVFDLADIGGGRVEGIPEIGPRGAWLLDIETIVIALRKGHVGRGIAVGRGGENVEFLDTRSLNVTLDSYGRKPSNTTSTVENLEKKGYLEFVPGENLHAHKTFRLTEQGFHEVRDLMRRLTRKNFSAVG